MSRCLSAVIAAAVTATGCGNGDEAPKVQGEDPFVAIEQRLAKPRVPHAAPRWQPVRTLSGTGPASERVVIRRDALQWRTRWECSAGRMVVGAGPPGTRFRRLLGGRCPGRGQAFSLQHGAVELDIQTMGSWRLIVEQQLDSPIHEPPLVEMQARGAEVVRRGDLYDVERKGAGRVELHRLENGRLALRLEEFATTTNSDLVLWLSAAPRPATSRDAFRTPYTLVAPLRSTIGEQNYLVPRGVPASHLRSLVIWCVPERIAYAAAALRP